MITGVAIRNKNILVHLPRPNRHVDCFSYLRNKGIDPFKHRIGMAADDQGFITAEGVFLDRKQALIYLRKHYQETVVPIEEIHSIVCSEDLW